MKTERLTIPLTGRAPVSIVQADWPCIAAAADKEWDNEHECQANRISQWRLTVRQHADGRAIVTARYSYSSAWQSERNFGHRDGLLVPAGESIPDALHAVVTTISEREHAGEDSARWESLLAEALAGLPAEEL